jgi:hypothetical protein
MWRRVEILRLRTSTTSNIILVSPNDCPKLLVHQVSHRRRSRYIGIAKTHLQRYTTAAAINLEHVADWFAETGREKTRRSVFVRVMEPVAA